MSVEATRRNLLQGWTPILGPLLIWFVHFMVVYGAALIWPHRPVANAIAIAATLVALIALGAMFMGLRATEARTHYTQFSKRFGLGSIFIATAGTLFDAAPALFA